MATKNKPNELYIERVFDAPVKMVWEAWMDPEQVAQWWGPRGFTITNEYKDARTGGAWKYLMHGPDGIDYPNHTKYLEVEEYARLVYDHGAYEDQAPLFRVTVNFKPVGNKTRLEMTMALATEQAAKDTKKFIKQVGGESTWDRLAEYLSADDKFVINRTFDADIDVMFDMWTDPAHLSQWLPPVGMTMEYLRGDIKAGGNAFFRMQGAELTMYGKCNYQQIQKPNLIVYTQVFCDKDGQLSRHPLAPTWPAEMLTTITLAEEDTNRTRVTVEWQINGDATSVERDTFRQGKLGMAQGWTGSFDKLEELLPSPAQE